MVASPLIVRFMAKKMNPTPSSGTMTQPAIVAHVGRFTRAIRNRSALLACTRKP